MITRFTENTSRRLSTVLAGTLLLTVLTACGTAAEVGLQADAFVGEVDGDLFVGVLVAEHPDGVQRDVVVYLCDGADVAVWLFGDTMSDALVLESDAARVELLLGAGTVTGEVALAGGEARPFGAAAAMGDAGVYRAEVTSEAGASRAQFPQYVGGWIVLNDLRQRGAITLGGVVMENPTLDPVTGQSETSIGTLSTVRCFINPFTGERICVRLN